jgi:hypothetical protein
MDEPTIESSFNLSRALGNAFSAVKIAFGPLWLGGMLLSMSDCGGGRFPTSLPIPPLGGDDKDSSSLLLPVPWSRGVSAAFSADSAGDDFATAFAAGALIIAVVVVVLIVGMFVLNAWLSTGFVRLQVAILEHGGEALAPLFSGRDRIWHLMGYKLMAGFSVSAAFLIAAWPGALIAYLGFARDSMALGFIGVGIGLLVSIPAAIYVGIGTYLGDLAVVLDGASPAQAMRRSFQLAGRGRLMKFEYAFVCNLVETAGSLGILLCCVGVLATVPLARAIAGFAKTESYLLLTRGTAQTESWYLWQRAAAQRQGRGPMPPAAPPPPAQPPAPTGP